jgi:flagellar motor protein MotB
MKMVTCRLKANDFCQTSIFIMSLGTSADSQIGDASGSVAMNQELSEDRAKAVLNHLIQQCSVPPRHIVALAAISIYSPVASNETEEGRAENRHAEIKILANKGTAGN